MRILLLDLDTLPGNTLTEAVRPLAADDRITLRNTPEAAVKEIGDSAYDLLLICSDDDNRLRTALRVVAPCRPSLPTVILSACDSAALAVDLLKAGADHFVVRDSEGRWIAQLPETIRTLDRQRHARQREEADDIARQQVEARLQESEQRLRQIVDGSAVAAFVIDRDHRITHWNRACAALTGFPASEMIGNRDYWRAFYPVERPCLADLVIDHAVDLLAPLYGNKNIHRSGIIDGAYEAEDFFPAFGSGGCWLYFTAAPLRAPDGAIIGAVETLQDITAQKRAEEELRQSEERYRVLSITDSMTGLYNTRHFAQRLPDEMERAERYRHPLALMVLDVDNFKQFNDKWGHVEGDQVLIRLAECITSCLRRTDQAFRYGGEEFVVLLPETGMDAAAAAAERVRALFAASEIVPAEGSKVQSTVSIGVTLFSPGESPRDFVARADSGTYEAKRQGKNRVVRILAGAGNIDG